MFARVRAGRAEHEIYQHGPPYASQICVQQLLNNPAVATALTPEGRHLRAVEFSGGFREFQRYSVHHNDELVVVLSGRYIADIDGEMHELGPGDAISYSGGVPHRYRVVGD